MKFVLKNQILNLNNRVHACGKHISTGNNNY